MSLNMQPLSYNFYTLFTYDPTNGILVPRYNLLINNVLLQENVAINRNTPMGGVNLFDNVGRTVVGTWNPQTRILTIAGFA